MAQSRNTTRGTTTKGKSARPQTTRSQSKSAQRNKSYSRPVSQSALKPHERHHFFGTLTLLLAMTALICTAARALPSDIQAWPFIPIVVSATPWFTLLALLALLLAMPLRRPLAALIAVALVFYNKMDQSELKLMWACVIAIGILYLISLCWVFAVQSKFVHPVMDTIHYSFVIAFQNLPETFLILVTIIAVIFLNVTQPFIVLFITLNFGIGWCFYLFAYFYRHVFDRYLNKDEHRRASKEADPILK